MRMILMALAALCLFGLPAQATEKAAEKTELNPLDEAAEHYVRLALTFRRFDKAYVDAYSGPEEWSKDAEDSPLDLDGILAEAHVLLTSLEGLPKSEGLGERRRQQLIKNVRALSTRARMAKGERLSFNEEAKLLFDVEVPDYDIAAFDASLTELDTMLPGQGPLAARAQAYHDRFIIPADKLKEVFDAALAECRRRTLEYIPLPETERFTVEFVKDQPWSAYNWFQGDAHSLIQVNTDLPIHVDRAVDLGCHEGYPGHHVHSILLERDLKHGRSWIEYSVLPLYGPMSPIAEGSANYGIEVAFPHPEKVIYERDVLFPMAGLDPATAAELDRFNELRRQLAYARTHFGRLYLDGEISKEAYLDGIVTYQLVSRVRAEKSLSFLETYRSYIINYSLGQDLVKAYVEKKAGGDPFKRWEIFTWVLSNPVGASDLK